METNNLEDITIENMLANIFTNTTIKKSRKDIVSYYRQNLMGDNLFSIPDGELEKRIDKVLKEDQKEKTPYLKYNNRKYFKARTSPDPKPIDTDKISKVFLGTAGECSVMAELLYRGYNVNNMKVDDGIDLVASKNNVLYYIQVKTNFVEEKNKFSFKIKKKSYERYIEGQMNYILVGRAKIGNDIRNTYFKLKNDDIEDLRFYGIIGQSTSDWISLSIEYDRGCAYAVNGNRRREISSKMNNFDL